MKHKKMSEIDFDQGFLDLCSERSLSMTSPIESTLSSNFSSLSSSYNSRFTEICGYFLLGSPRFLSIPMMIIRRVKTSFPIMHIISTILLARRLCV